MLACLNTVAFKTKQNKMAHDFFRARCPSTWQHRGQKKKIRAFEFMSRLLCLIIIKNITGAFSFQFVHAKGA